MPPGFDAVNHSQGGSAAAAANASSREAGPDAGRDVGPDAGRDAAMPPVPVSASHGAALVLFDFTVIGSALLAAYLLRFHAWEPLGFPEPVEIADHPLSTYLGSAAIMAGLWVYFLGQKGAYGQTLTATALSLWAGAGARLACGWKSLVGLMALSTMWQDLMLARWVYVLAWPLGWLFLMSGRLLIGLARRRRGRTIRRVALMGASPALDSLAHRMRGAGTRIEAARLPWPAAAPARPGLDPAAAQTDASDASYASGASDASGASGASDVSGASGASCPSQLSRLSPLPQTPIEILERLAPTDVVVDLSAGAALDQGDALLDWLNACEARKLPLYALSGPVAVTVREDDLSDFMGAPLARLRDAAIHPAYAVAKRILDVIFSLFVLAAGLPLWAAIALLVRMSGPGGVLYRQKRAGIDGRPFVMYKFRTMKADADRHIQELIASGALPEPVFNIRGDPRVTRVGWWLRRLSLDEIPQIWNVLRGDMSWIGPRPERTELVDLYTPYQRRRLKGRPGISGYQQVASRGEPSLARRVELDLYYLKRQGFWMDFSVALRTVWVVIWGHGLK